MRQAHLVIASLLGSGLAAQATWIVDAAGGGNFLDIPPAIAAAAPGDHIEVRGSGSYSAFVLDRGVELWAPQHATVPTIEVVGVPLGQHARITGLYVQRQGGVLQVSVRSCAGSVLLADVREVGTAYQATRAYPGLELVDAARVYVHGGLFLGQHATGGADGIVLVRSNACLSGTLAQGGTAVSPSSTSGNSGRPGIQVGSGSHLLLDGVVAQGGNASGASLVGGDGGDGLVVGSNALAIAVGQCTFTGTPGGQGSFHQGSPGDAIAGNAHYTLDCVLNGPVTGATAVPVRPVLRPPMTVQLGSRLDVAARGAPGQLLFPMFDLVHDHLPLAAFDGALVLSSQAVAFGLVGLDGNGAGSFGFVVPNDQRLRGTDVFCQAAAVVAGAPVLLAPAHARAQ